MKSSLKNFSAAIAGIILGFGCPFSGLGAVANVLVASGGLVFTPVTTNIMVNDQVIWTWAGSPGVPHSTTSGTVVGTTATPNGLWSSGTATTPHSFTNTFTSAGTFPYYCSVHFAAGMKGTIIVAAPNVPPTVNITSPLNSAVFSEPASVNIQATASDPNSGGTITNVQFLVGPTTLTNETAAPFADATDSLTAGSYTLSAVAADNFGLTATNAITISVVTPAPLALATATQLSSSSFQFNYSASTGLTYVVQQASDLTASNWTSISTNTAAVNPVTFVDTNAISNPGFYRVLLLPNP